MKVVMINGSPNKEGTTYTALCEVGKGLEEYGVEWEILHVGKNVKTGCIGCFSPMAAPWRISLQLQ